MTRLSIEQRRAYDREWHAKNRDARNAAQYNRQRDLRKRFMEYKKTLSCQRCGFSHYRAIHFHHRNPSEKFMPVSQMIHHQYAWEKIMAEVAKCDILCANCHAILHVEE